MERKLYAGLAVVLLLCGALLAQERRSVVLEIGLPNGETPQLRILDGGTGTVEMPSVGKFGFVPTINDSSVSVDILDVNTTPHLQLDRIDAAVGGVRVQSRTKPQFGIRVIR
jgi:hypothetical protein